MPIRAFLLAVLMVGLITQADLPRADAACEADYCTERTTNEDGFYLLTIPAGGIALIPGGSALADCKWEVEAQFSDGSPPETYFFDATQPFQSSHTFPEPGVYFVDIYATEGVHGAGPSKCPDLHIQAKVTYPEPPQEPEEPGPEGPGISSSGGGAAATAQPPVIVPAPQPEASTFWRDCGGGVLAHRVPCPKARRVIGAARSLLAHARPSDRLAEGAIFKAAGFSCRLRKGDATSVSCRRGRQRVLGT